MNIWHPDKIRADFERIVVVIVKKLGKQVYFCSEMMKTVKIWAFLKNLRMFFYNYVDILKVHMFCVFSIKLLAGF